MQWYKYSRCTAYGTPSRGTVADQFYCTVQLVTVVSLLDNASHLPPATRIPTTTVNWKTPVRKLLLFWFASPQNLHLRNSHLVTSFTYNSTGITSHVLTTLQHTMACNIIVKCHHVATAVAGPNLQVGAALPGIKTSLPLPMA